MERYNMTVCFILALLICTYIRRSQMVTLVSANGQRIVTLDYYELYKYSY